MGFMPYHFPFPIIACAVAPVAGVMRLCVAARVVVWVIEVDATDPTESVALRALLVAPRFRFHGLVKVSKNETRRN